MFAIVINHHVRAYETEDDAKDALMAFEEANPGITGKVVPFGKNEQKSSTKTQKGD